MAEPVFQRPGEWQTVDNPLGADVVFKARGEQTEGALTAFENAVAPSDGPPLHTHANEDESMYVLEGEMRFKLGDEMRMLIHFTPSGMERFFDGFAALDTPGPAAFETVGAEVGMDVVGPPLAQSDPV